MLAPRVVRTVGLAAIISILSIQSCLAAKISYSRWKAEADTPDAVTFCHLQINGTLMPGDENSFRATVRIAYQSGCIIESLSIVSPGGDLGAAIAIGEQVDLLALSVQAPPVFGSKPEPNRVCASACFFIWAAGKERSGDAVAVHRPYFDPAYYHNLPLAEARKRFASMTEKARQFLDAQGVTKELIAKIFSANSREAIFLSKSELSQLRLKPFYDELLIARCKESQKEAEARANAANTKPPPGVKSSVRYSLMMMLQAKIGFISCKHQVLIDLARQVKEDYLKVIGSEGVDPKARSNGAIDSLVELATKGDAQAQYELANRHIDTAGGVPKVHLEAVHWLRKAAEQGHADAQADLGAMYAVGLGVQQDYVAGAAWLRQAAEKDHLEAQANLGMLYVGSGLERNPVEGAKWLHRAAEKGHPVAQMALGTLYSTGDGVPKDLARAAHWLGQAAEQGDAMAQLFLADQYVNGQGVLQDYVQAHKWYNIAASRFTEKDRVFIFDATRKREEVASKMTPAQIAEAQRLAREWQPK